MLIFFYRESRKFFVKNPDGIWVPKLFEKHYVAPGDRRLVDIIGVENGGPGGRRRDEAGHRKWATKILRKFF